MRRSFADSLPVLVFLLLLAAGWEIGTTIFDIPHYIIPKLSDVIVSIWENGRVLGKHFTITLGKRCLD